jgi:GNAT superfamily N-acetyltransferase
MLHATRELARRVDRAEIDFCAAASRAGEPGGAASIEVGGGRGLCSSEGSPLNKVLGLGLGAPVSDADLDALEAFYDERGIPVQIELCPLAPVDVATRLAKRGYELQGFENQLVRVMPASPLPMPERVRVSLAGGNLDARWLRVVAESFALPDGSAADATPSAETVTLLGQVMQQFVHPGIDRLIGWIGDEAASGGCCYVMNGVAGIAGTATLPRHRGQGAQHALVTFALNHLIGRAELAMATTEPGSVSQRTFERLGFQVVYTRAIFVLPG